MVCPFWAQSARPSALGARRRECDGKVPASSVFACFIPEAWDGLTRMACVLWPLSRGHASWRGRGVSGAGRLGPAPDASWPCRESVPKLCGGGGQYTREGEDLAAPAPVSHSRLKAAISVEADWRLTVWLVGRWAS
jgi:hypothetical protein